MFDFLKRENPKIFELHQRQLRAACGGTDEVLKVKNGF
ncbi:MAG: hypothetical protein ACI9XO_003923 [Paraglaciecola sp.]|jgi:hypothetical protein